jgi:hypothetical protein
MTDEEHMTEGVGESIEDLEAPLAAQMDVGGGMTICTQPTCQGDSTVSTFCKLGPSRGTCLATAKACKLDTSAVVVSEL